VIVEHLQQNYGRFLAAICIWREARGENIECKRGVYWTLVNRAAAHPSPWPADLAGVVLQPHQFSSFNRNDPNSVKFPASSDPSWADCCAVVDDPGADPTGGAVYYESFPDDQIEAVRVKQPWFAEEKLTVKIASIRFYTR
jgi:cell wall hydrolase